MVFISAAVTAGIIAYFYASSLSCNLHDAWLTVQEGFISLTSTQATPQVTNHASTGLGATVIGVLSSPSYLAGKPWSFQWSDAANVKGYGPETVLTGPLELGRCWRFAGSVGHLGIQLVEPVHINFVAVAHVPKSLALDFSIAPKDIELWGIVEGSSDDFQDSFDQLCSRNRRSCKHLSDFVTTDAARSPLPHSLETSRLVFLGLFHYNITEADAYQRFPVAYPEGLINIKFQRIIFSVLNNWGASRYTCIYKFEVYGQA